MTHLWDFTPNDTNDAPAQIRPVAYCRHSAQDRQENSIPIQRDQVSERAEKHGVEIVEKFAEHGKSSITSKGCPSCGGVFWRGSVVQVRAPGRP